MYRTLVPTGGPAVTSARTGSARRSMRSRSAKKLRQLGGQIRMAGQPLLLLGRLAGLNGLEISGNRFVQALFGIDGLLFVRRSWCGLENLGIVSRHGSLIDSPGATREAFSGRDAGARPRL